MSSPEPNRAFSSTCLIAPSTAETKNEPAMMTDASVTLYSRIRSRRIWMLGVSFNRSSAGRVSINALVHSLIRPIHTMHAEFWLENADRLPIGRDTGTAGHELVTDPRSLRLGADATRNASMSHR